MNWIGIGMGNGIVSDQSNGIRRNFNSISTTPLDTEFLSKNKKMMFNENQYMNIYVFKITFIHSFIAIHKCNKKKEKQKELNYLSFVVYKATGWLADWRTRDGDSKGRTREHMVIVGLQLPLLLLMRFPIQPLHSSSSTSVTR